MVKEANVDTEQKILEAAAKVFITKGFDGARMQDIADEAAINKSMLHYYYRSKDKLFERVFSEQMQEHTRLMTEALLSDLEVREKLTLLVFNHYEACMKTPEMSLFILNEVNRNSDKIKVLIQMDVVTNCIQRLKDQMRQEVSEGKINNISPDHLICDLISMLEFPMMAAPMLTSVLFDNDYTAYRNMLEERKKHVTYVLNRLLTP